MKAKFVLIVAIAILIPAVLLAWGRQGHEIVVSIALSLTDAKTKDSVQKYLDGMSPKDAGNWMDDMRSNHSYDYMKPWHYVNIEKGKQYENTKDDNIVNALNKAINNLEHRENLSKEEIKTNLLVVCHLAGDFHQPLHVGYETDRGGNTIQVKYLDHNTNLHKVWDSEIIDGERITIDDCMAISNRFSKDEMGQLQVVDVQGWLTEPRALLANVYDFQDNTIDRVYIDRNKKVVEQQLFIAGARLAAVFEQIFK